MIWECVSFVDTILFQFGLMKQISWILYRQKSMFSNGRLLGVWKYCFLMAEFYSISLFLNIFQKCCYYLSYLLQFFYSDYILKRLKNRADQQITKDWIWDIGLLLGLLVWGLVRGFFCASFSWLYCLKCITSVIFCELMFMHSIAGQFLLEESRLIEAAEMAKKAAELDNMEFDVVFNAAHMLRFVLVHLPHLIFLFFWAKKSL